MDKREREGVYETARLGPRRTEAKSPRTLKVRQMDMEQWRHAITVWTLTTGTAPLAILEHDDLMRAIGGQWINTTYEEYRPILIWHV